MSASTEQYVQLDFFALLPGAAGGRALLAQRGVEHFKQMAEKAAERPRAERQAQARKAQATRLRRLYHEPRTRTTIEIDEVVTERIVPYWPHQKRRRHRKRPIFVHIELSRVPCESSYELRPIEEFQHIQERRLNNVGCARHKNQHCCIKV